MVRCQHHSNYPVPPPPNTQCNETPPPPIRFERKHIICVFSSIDSFPWISSENKQSSQLFIQTKILLVNRSSCSTCNNPSPNVFSYYHHYTHHNLFYWIPITVVYKCFPKQLIVLLWIVELPHFRGKHLNRRWDKIYENKTTILFKFSLNTKVKKGNFGVWLLYTRLLVTIELLPLHMVSLLQVIISSFQNSFL